ncbi:MAG: DMT family transporter [Patescibacteria group bacterium]
MKEERKGELYIFGEALLWGVFPVVTVLSIAFMPAMVALGWSAFFASIFFAILLTVRKKWGDVLNAEALPDMLWTTLIIGVLFYVLFFFGLTYTSPGNASIIALSETFFSFCLFNVLRKEYIARSHIIGAILMLVGAGIVLYPNVHSFRTGDLLIVVASFIAPFGNLFQRRARTRVSSESIMFVRSLASVPVIFGLAYLFGARSLVIPSGGLLLLLLVNGFFIFGLSKILWIEGIHRINIAKANALATIAPIVTLIGAYFLLADTPSLWQVLAFVPMCAGVLFLSQKA